MRRTNRAGDGQMHRRGAAAAGAACIPKLRSASSPYILDAGAGADARRVLEGGGKP